MKSSFRFVPIKMTGLYASRVIPITLAVLMGVSYAITPGNAQAPNLQYQQYLQHKQREDMMNRLPPPTSTVVRPSQAAPVSTSESCVKVSTIELDHSALLPQQDFDALRHQWEGRCMSLGDMNLVLDKINKVYIDKGYLTTRAYLPQQDLSKGILHIIIIEGKITGFSFEGMPADHHETMAFPWLKGSVLDLHELEEGMDQMNRLPDWNASMKIAPGQNAGNSIVKIKTPDPGIFHAQASVDNYGQSNSGQTIGRSFFTAEDMLGLLDLWSFEYDHSLNNRQGDGHNSFFSAEGSIPLGPWTFFGGWWRYDDMYHVHSALNVAPLRFDSTNKDFHIGASRVVARNAVGVTTLQAMYELKSFDSMMMHSRINTQSATLSSLNFTASESMHILGGAWYASLGMKIGLGEAMGTKTHIDNAGPFNPKTQYVKPSLDLDGYQPIAKNILWHTAIHGEYSSKNQYGNEEMQIGGPYTVRGFMQQTLIGNAGIYMRNDLSWSLPTQTMQCGAYQLLCDHLAKGTEIYGIFDVGMTRAIFTYTDMPKTMKGGTLTGAGLGIRKTSGKIFWNASLTHALTHANLPHEGWIALFNVGVKL